MTEKRKKELMSFFNLDRERTPEEKGRMALYEEYENKFGEKFGYIWGFHRDKDKFPTDEDMIKYCLKKGKPMSKLYPGYYKKDYSKKKGKIYFE